MSIRIARGLDLLPAAGALLAAVMLGVYLSIIHDQGTRPPAWVITAFVVGGAAAAYGSLRSAPLHRAALTVGAVVLLGLGTLALASVGLPIVLAGALTLAGAVREDATT